MSEDKHQSCYDLRCMSCSVLQDETDRCDTTKSGRKAAAPTASPSFEWCAIVLGLRDKGVGLLC